MKSNSTTETLRLGRKPKAEAVRDAKETPGLARDCVAKQNDGNVIPSGRDYPTRIAACGK